MTARGVVPLVVVPAHDEAAAIGAVVRGAIRHAPVVVVDDGSCDATAARAREAGADVIRHAQRLGKGQAIHTGVAAARARGASLVVTMDADGQHDPADLPALLSAAAATPDAVIVGRRQAAEVGALPVERRNAVRVASFFVSWLTGQRVEDSQCGLRAYPMALFSTVRTRQGGFVFETEILVAAARGGWRVVEVPVAARARTDASSRFRPYADGARIAAFLALRVAAAWARTGVRAVAAAAHRPGATAHAGARGGVSAAAATLAVPAVLPLLVMQTLVGPRLPDVVTPLVRSLYDPERLDELPPPRRAEGAAETLVATSP